MTNDETNIDLTTAVRAVAAARPPERTFDDATLRLIAKAWRQRALLADLCMALRCPPDAVAGLVCAMGEPDRHPTTRAILGSLGGRE